jgi:hypothetical protein
MTSRFFGKFPIGTILVLLVIFAMKAIGADAEMPIDPEEDFSPMLGMFALVAICIMIALIGAGIVVGAIVAASMALLVALGITSSAVLIGIFRKRFSAGLRAFHYQFCAFAAIPAGVGALWLGNRIAASGLELREVLIIGSIAGVASGLVLAFAFDLIAGMIYRRVRRLSESRKA